jgi:hypothetical protein
MRAWWVFFGGCAVQPVITFFQSNLVLILSFLLTAVVFFTLGLLSRRRHVIQILPAPVSPGLERAISAALASREIVYVQPVPSSVVEPVVKQASAPTAAAPVAAAMSVAAAPIVIDQPAYSKPASGEKQALSKVEEIVHEIEALAAKIAHEVATALDAAAREALLAILAHMEHHGDDTWFADMKDKIEHAHSNEDLSACAAEMLKHLHH